MFADFVLAVDSWVNGFGMLSGETEMAGEMAALESLENVELAEIESVELANAETVTIETVEGEVVEIEAAAECGSSIGEAGLVENEIKTSYGKSSKNLQFDKNDMVYGPSANGKLLELQRKSGGKLLSDIGNPYENGYGDDWLSFSTDTIENTINAGYKIRFDLTYMDDIDGVLNGTGKYANSITAGELRYIQDNWSQLSGGVIFYFNGEEVLPPWMN